MFHAHGLDEGSKVSRIKIWKQVEKTSGFKPESLENEPIINERIADIWSLYNEIRKGCDNISYAELDSFQKVTGAELSAWEVSVMIEIDFIRRTNG